MDLEKYRRDSHDSWERVAPNWERGRDLLAEMMGPVGERMVALLEPAPGQTILELAAGVGETGFAAAGRIGDGGRLISTDFSSQMLAAGQRRAAQLGLENVEFREMDAERMDLADDAVDGVLCRFGYMLMADPAAAFAETRRVLQDGGRVVFSVWAEAPRNPWAAIAGGALVGHGHLPQPEPGAPGAFAMGDPARINSLLADAGFGAPAIEEATNEWRFDEFDEYLNFICEFSAGLGTVIERLDEPQRAEVRSTMESAAESFRANGAYAFPGVALIVAAS